MTIPVRLYRRTRDGAICDTLAPGESGRLLYGAGAELPDSVAEQQGIAAYLRARSLAAQVKAVQPDELGLEDKAVAQETTEDKAVPAPRRRP